ncbi:hypothetical protein CQ12_29060 [Bradyrhizobium jicamae]|uniref:Uncharacterized protein n=1 Tax=Bradyrhizobium jicamae TaxID=280332 RepID=A0A0R3M6Z6_9BRAD|nr:hypothetical protein CQ12_29060 [Bradyrhizobium jicamae]
MAGPRRPALLSSLHAGYADDGVRQFPGGEQTQLVRFEDPQLMMMYRPLRDLGRQKEFDVGDGLSRNYRNACF